MQAGSTNIASCMLSISVYNSQPSFVGCDSPRLSYAGALALTAAICSVAFFVIGAVFGMLCLYFTLMYKQSHARKNDQPVVPPLPVYEDVHVNKNDIELKDNVSYGPIRT